MNVLRLAGYGLAAAMLCGAISPQVVQTYRYDAHGRLIQVSRTGDTPSSTVDYTLDDADNRTARERRIDGVAAETAAPSSLPSEGERPAAPVERAEAREPDPGMASPDGARRARGGPR